MKPKTPEEEKAFDLVQRTARALAAAYWLGRMEKMRPDHHNAIDAAIKAAAAAEVEQWAPMARRIVLHGMEE